MIHVRRTAADIANWIFADPPPDLSFIPFPPTGCRVNGMEPIELVSAGDHTFQARYSGAVVIGQPADTTQDVLAVQFTDGSTMRPGQQMVVENDD